APLRIPPCDGIGSPTGIVRIVLHPGARGGTDRSEPLINVGMARRFLDQLPVHAERILQRLWLRSDAMSRCQSIMGWQAGSLPRSSPDYSRIG
ncbi:MAG: hypothetical protein QGG10_07505, partial [Arenicellales bacterium]|nr:hypothetical protein [Arenicellales bacterium]